MHAITLLSYLATGSISSSLFFFFNDPATTEIYTLSLHDALPISFVDQHFSRQLNARSGIIINTGEDNYLTTAEDRKSTRLNSSHANISYAVFCLKKKKKTITIQTSCNIKLMNL